MNNKPKIIIIDTDNHSNKDHERKQLQAYETQKERDHYTAKLQTKFIISDDDDTDGFGEIKEIGIDKRRIGRFSSDGNFNEKERIRKPRKFDIDDLEWMDDFWDEV